MDYEAPAFVAIGGFAGALCRHAVAVVLPASFPWGTLAVNVVGAFALGLLAYHTRADEVLSDRARLVASTGFVSSFTTYSTFAGETVALDPALAALNVVGTYAFGFAAVLLARGVTR